MRARVLLAAALVSTAALSLYGCAQILGLEERHLGAPDDGGTDATFDDAQTTDAAPPQDGAPNDVASPPDADIGDGGLDGPTIVTCDGGTFDLWTSPTHCGSCDKVCPGFAPQLHSVAVCNGGHCASRCQGSFVSCDKDASNGCERDLDADIAGCGACGHVCGASAGLPSCVGGACFFDCDPGWAHCSTDDSMGCETDLNGDPNNCGQCNNPCDSGVCDSGSCAP